MKQMEILSREQLLDIQIKLLNMPGQTLSSFYEYDFQHKMFQQPCPQIKQKISQLYKLKGIKTTVDKKNAPFHIFSWVLLSLISEQKEKPYLLQRFKCTLYSQNLNLLQVKGGPHSNLSNKLMKKLLVEFLQVAHYYSGKLQSILSRYNIVLEILTLLFRYILKVFQIKGSQDYNKPVNSLQALTGLLDYFELVYNIQKSIIVLQGRKTCIYLQPKTGECYTGERFDSLNDHDQDQFLKIQDQEQDQNQIRKLLSITGLTPTPCFQLLSPQPFKVAHSGHNIKIQQYMQIPSQNEQSNSKQQAQNYRRNQLEINGWAKQQSLQIDTNINTPPQNQKNIHGRHSFIENPEYDMKISCIEKVDYGDKQQTFSEIVGAMRRKSNPDQQNEQESKASQFQYKYEDNEQKKNNSVLVFNSKYDKRYKTAVFQDLKFSKRRQDKVYNHPLKVESNRVVKQVGKCPQFLTNKNKNQTSRPSNSPISCMKNAHQQNKAKPKVYFTYSNRVQKIQLSNSMLMQPNKLNYYAQPFNMYQLQPTMERPATRYYYSMVQKGHFGQQRSLIINKKV